MLDVIGLDSRENILLRRSNSAAMMVATRLFYSGAATPALIFLAKLYCNIRNCASIFGRLTATIGNFRCSCLQREA
jgi:hypothetical protein